jgi:hypothetical protein
MLIEPSYLPYKGGWGLLDVSAQLRAALLQALGTTLAALPSSAFPMPTTTLYTVHLLPARPFSRTATSPVDIKHSTFKSLSAFLRTAEKGGLLKLKDARPDTVVVAVYPTHADVVSHHRHRTVGEEDERRRRAEAREAQQVADATSAEKNIAVTELWKPHLGTLPLFKDLGLGYSSFIPCFDFLLFAPLIVANQLQHRHPIHSRRGQVNTARIRRETRPCKPRRTTVPQRQRRCGILRGALRPPKRQGHDACSRICQARRGIERAVQSHATLVPYCDWRRNAHHQKGRAASNFGSHQGQAGP